MKADAPKKALTYIPAHDLVPDAGGHTALKPGLRWLRMPLPFELNHINLWLMESATGWTIVDTGFNFAETLAHWDNVFAELFAQKPVEGIFITHFHPDHFGLAGWLAARTGVTVRMVQAEYDIARSLVDDGSADALEKAYRDYYAQAGLDSALLNDMLARRFTFRKMIHAPPAAIRPVAPNETVRLGGGDWKIIGGYGHSPEHACLYNAADGIFIAGDIVLPDISPNISLYPGSAGDPVGEYLATLDVVEREVPDSVTILPSHGVPFRGLHKRLGELRAHHARRLDKLRKTLEAGPQTGLEAMRGLFSHRELKPGDVFFALGETMAHLVHLQKLGEVRDAARGDARVFSLA